jgi:hypothetical protein
MENTEKMPYFSKMKYAQWMADHNLENEGLLEYLNNDLLNKIDGENITNWHYSSRNFGNFTILNDYKDKLNNEWKVKEVFAVPIFNDYNELAGSYLIHPDWVEWR